MSLEIQLLSLYYMDVYHREDFSRQELTYKKQQWESTKVYTAFLFLGHGFWKENSEDKVKLLELNVLSCCLKLTMAYLHKIGLKTRE